MLALPGMTQATDAPPPSPQSHCEAALESPGVEEAEGWVRAEVAEGAA